MLDFLKLAAEKQQLAEELVELARKHDFEFSDEVSNEELEKVAGGQKYDGGLEDPGFAEPERNTYFTGKILTEKDLGEEQKYPWKPAP
jgi:hypothetical protein